MKRFSDKHQLHTLSELNVTPLLDLAFVLLIIFMITTPLMENSANVVLPSSDAAANAVPVDAVQTVSLGRDESIALNGSAFDLAALQAELARLHRERPETAVVIRSHHDLPVQKLVDVMSAVQRAGVAKVGVVTQPQP